MVAVQLLYIWSGFTILTHDNLPWTYSNLAFLDGGNVNTFYDKF